MHNSSITTLTVHSQHPPKIWKTVSPKKAKRLIGFKIRQKLIFEEKKVLQSLLKPKNTVLKQNNPLSI